MQIGDRVFIKKFKRDGFILSVEDRNKFRVSLGGLTLLLHADEIEPSKSAAPEERARSGAGVSITPVSHASGGEKETLDLHGFTVSQALIALEDKLNRAIMAKQSRLKIVHGFGSGRVMHAVHEYLRKSSLVSNFRVDDLNPGQTWVWL